MSTLDTFTEASEINATDILHIKRGTGANSDKKIQAANLLIKSKSIIIENPISAEDISFFFASKAITITEIRAVLTGSASPSVTWTVRHDTDRSAVGSEVVTGGTVTADTTVGSDVTSFDDATVVADSHLWIETTAKSGTVTSIIITLFYTQD